ncbi:MAG: chemotaxis protein CheD [Roseovarius sp.]
MRDPNRNVIHVIQGQFHVSGRPQDEITTVLGSCVAVCLHDPLNRIGGMNHFLLPGNDPREGRNVKYGAHSMEQLVNGMLRAGAQRYRLEAHVFGGGNVVKGLSRIGDSNAAFAREFIQQEGFVLRTVDVGGTLGRRLRFLPYTGQTRVEKLDPSLQEIQRSERRPATVPRPVGAVELF